jgi:hypothetical protein
MNARQLLCMLLRHMRRAAQSPSCMLVSVMDADIIVVLERGKVGGAALQHAQDSCLPQKAFLRFACMYAGI